MQVDCNGSPGKRESTSQPAHDRAVGLFPLAGDKRCQSLVHVHHSRGPSHASGRVKHEWREGTQLDLNEALLISSSLFSLMASVAGGQLSASVGRRVRVENPHVEEVCSFSGPGGL